MDLQAYIKGMSIEWQVDRAKSQMTLGKLIERLGEFPPDADIEAFGNPHSYRGYYEDLAFEKEEGTRKASVLIDMCKALSGEVLEGYKGGEFPMHKNTPVWIANYGELGNAIIAINDDGTISLSQREL